MFYSYINDLLDVGKYMEVHTKCTLRNASTKLILNGAESLPSYTYKQIRV